MPLAGRGALVSYRVEKSHKADSSTVWRLQNGNFAQDEIKAQEPPISGKQSCLPGRVGARPTASRSRLGVLAEALCSQA